MRTWLDFADAADTSLMQAMDAAVVTKDREAALEHMRECKHNLVRAINELEDELAGFPPPEEEEAK
jgi:hypothetical protein